MTKSEIEELYLERARRYYSSEETTRKRITLVSILRLITFLLGVLLTVYAFKFSSLCGSLVLVLSVSAFLVLLRYFNRLSDRAGYYSRIARINKDESGALAGNYSHFDGAAGESDTSHDFSADTDLFGVDSVFSMLNRTFTIYGRGKLAEWLKHLAGIKHELGQRQNAVKEISTKLDWRQDFSARGMVSSLEDQDIKDFQDWLTGDEMIFSNRIKRAALVFFPSLSVLSLILMIAGVAEWQIFACSFLFNLLLVAGGLKKTNRIHTRLSGKNRFLSSFGELLNCIKKEEFHSEIFVKMKGDLFGEEMSAEKMMNKLSVIANLFDSRLNMFAGFVLNGLVLWDYQCLKALGGWKSAASGHFTVWLDYIGETEAYISLANFAYNNPEFTFPVNADDKFVLKAESMGHPMIAEDKRVCNDISVEEGEIIVVTGANMSGKSTFLRTVAVNMILASSGAPVCAASMRFKPFRLFTSMRTSDSLSHGESYFYAELKRLRVLKELLEKDENILFLLDEILKGTNSVDKSTGSKLFVTRLTQLGATGLIATHDISLGELEKLPGSRVKNKCFEIEIEGEKVFFDYRLRNGVTSRMNAAILMKEMGIAD